MACLKEYFEYKYLCDILKVLLRIGAIMSKWTIYAITHPRPKLNTWGLFTNMV